MNKRYLIRTILGEQVINTYESEAQAREALQGLQQRYREDGLYLVRMDPRVIEVINPK